MVQNYCDLETHTSAQLHLWHGSLLCLLTHSSIAINSSHVPSGLDGLRTVPFWLCLASGCLHLKTWLRKLHFVKYSSVEQDHIKHFLPFHTGFGIKCCIECFSIFCYLWPGSKIKSSLKAHGLTACVPLAQQGRQVMLLCVRQGFPTGQSQNAKSTPRSLNTTLSLQFHLQDVLLCLLKHKNTAAKQMYMKWPKQRIQHCSPSGRKRRR